jgi:hypothetical protein
MRFVLPPMRRPRHPLARALSLVLGVALVAVLLVFGLVVAGVLLVGGLVLLGVRQWNRARKTARPAMRAGHRPEVLEGEFVVIRQTRPAAH